MARVYGNVTCTGCEENTGSVRMCVVNELDIPSKKETGKPILAINTVGAAQGDLVLCAAGYVDVKAEETYEQNTDYIIVGIVDTIDLIGKQIYQKRTV